MGRWHPANALNASKARSPCYPISHSVSSPTEIEHRAPASVPCALLPSGALHVVFGLAVLLLRSVTRTRLDRRGGATRPFVRPSGICSS